MSTIRDYVHQNLAYSRDSRIKKQEQDCCRSILSFKYFTGFEGGKSYASHQDIYIQNKIILKNKKFTQKLSEIKCKYMGSENIRKEIIKAKQNYADGLDNRRLIQIHQKLEQQNTQITKLCQKWNSTPKTYQQQQAHSIQTHSSPTIYRNLATTDQEKQNSFAGCNLRANIEQLKYKDKLIEHPQNQSWSRSSNVVAQKSLYQNRFSKENSKDRKSSTQQYKRLKQLKSSLQKIKARIRTSSVIKLNQNIIMGKNNDYLRNVEATFRKQNKQRKQLKDKLLFQFNILTH